MLSSVFFNAGAIYYYQYNVGIVRVLILRYYSWISGGLHHAHP
jgi:hypothetical protein